MHKIPPEFLPLKKPKTSDASGAQPMTDQLPGGYRVQALPDGCRNCRHADWTESNCQDSVEVGACTFGRRGLGINESYEAWAAHSRDYLEGRTVHPAGICDKYEKGRR